MSFLRKTYPRGLAHQRGASSLYRKHVCDVCHKEGSRGAEWILVVDEKRYNVHYPCGRAVLEEIPESSNAQMFPCPDIVKKTRANAFIREQLGGLVVTKGKKILDGDT